MRDNTETTGRCGGHRFKFGEGPHGFGPPGHGHGHGRGPWSRARRGNVRAAILSVLSDEPMHGYQIMQRLEERSGGMWRPSPGSVYPTLQMLEDEGLIKGEEIDGKRVFSLTEAGVTAAAESKERHGAPWERDDEKDASPHYRLRRALFQLGAAVRQVGAEGTAAQVEQTLEILVEARKRVYALLAAGE
jgi:DNA-binding PadR family transcriptional regulator